MLFLFRFSPLSLVERWEECVGTWRSAVHQGEIKLVGHGQSLPVDRGTAYNKHLVITVRQMCLFLTAAKGLRQRPEYFATVKRLLPSAQDDVATAWQSSVRQRLESLATHYYGMAIGDGFKAGQVLGYVPRQTAFVSYGLVCRHCDDDAESQITKAVGRFKITGAESGTCELLIFHSCG